MTQSIVYICLFLGIIDSIPNSSVQSYCFNIDYIYVYFYDKGFENEWEQVRKSLNQLCFFLHCQCLHKDNNDRYESICVMLLISI